MEDGQTHDLAVLVADDVVVRQLAVSGMRCIRPPMIPLLGVLRAPWLHVTKVRAHGIETQLADVEIRHVARQGAGAPLASAGAGASAHPNLGA